MSLRLREDPTMPVRSRKRRSTHAVAEEDMGLWHALRACRKELADAQDVPAYVIFSDATLAAMIEVRPRTPSELLGVSGVGRTKLEKYGDAFLRVIRGADDDAEAAAWVIEADEPIQ